MSGARVSTEPNWESIPEPQWSIYREVVREANAQNVRFALGGAFATAAYTGELRNTKDIDFYILPADRQAMQRAMANAGLKDLYDRLPYDRSWIYRGSRDDIIVDAIWAMANHRAEVDQDWLDRGRETAIRGMPLRTISVEELIWSKLYVLQRERCDWGDVLNLLDAQAGSIEWERLLDRLAGDTPLLAGALSLFAWLAPDRAALIPPKVWPRLGLRGPEQAPDPETLRSRADLLDSRPWFIRHFR